MRTAAPCLGAAVLVLKQITTNVIIITVIFLGCAATGRPAASRLRRRRLRPARLRCRRRARQGGPLSQHTRKSAHRQVVTHINQYMHRSAHTYKSAHAQVRTYAVPSQHTHTHSAHAKVGTSALGVFDSLYIYIYCMHVLMYACSVVSDE